MKFDINRIAAYLAGNFPPYYEQFSKIKFIKVLLAQASSIFPEKEEFDFIDKHSSSLQVFFKECLSLIEQEEVLSAITEKLEVPDEALGRDFIQSKKQSIAVENKTIGFITPFDDEKEDTEKVIKNILNKDFSDWELKECSLKDDGDGKILWESIKDFSGKYEVYIVDFRGKNLNVAIELGYILALEKPFILIVSEDLPSDIKGFIYVKKEEVNIKAVGGEVTEKQKENIKEKSEKFEKNLKEKLNRYLK